MPIELHLPKLGETMLEGVVIRWLKKEGDDVSRGEVLLEVETDKAISEVSAAAGGRLLKILAPEGTAVKVGEAFALVGESGEAPVDASDTAIPIQKATEAKQLATSPRVVTGRVPASPAARRLAAKLGISLDTMAGSGQDGMIVERDVEMAATAKSPPEPEIDATVIPLTGARKIIAERMIQSRQTTAQVTTFIDVDMTRIGQLRRQVGATYTAFVVTAVARLLPEYPYLNASLKGDRVLLRNRINIGVAVAAGDVLVVPVIRDADKKSLAQIAKELTTLVEKGRRRQLTAEDMQEATFTVTNPGVFGALFSTPIINLPQSGILGTGRVGKVPVVRDDQISIGEVMFLSLSYDHRLVDGGPAAQFLQRLKQLLENPNTLME